MKYFLLALSSLVLVVSGCAMFTAWKSIPPPGGCDQCHIVAISTNWQVNYQAANVSDERGRLSFQTPEFNQQVSTEQEKPLEAKKVEQKACFDCHKSPNPQHRERKGNFHH